jgi:hypothetical protein
MITLQTTRHEQQNLSGKDKHYAVHYRPDNIAIDSRYYRSLMYNPLAVGHRINHVPPSETPNVIPMAYNFPRIDSPREGCVRLTSAGKRFIPNIYFEERTASRVLLSVRRNIYIYTFIFFLLTSPALPPWFLVAE